MKKKNDQGANKTSRACASVGYHYSLVGLVTKKINGHQAPGRRC